MHHEVIGTSESDTGVTDQLSLYKEYSQLFISALQDSLHEPEMPQGDKEPDLLLEETTKEPLRIGMLLFAFEV